MQQIAEIEAFLNVATPEVWVDHAVQNLDILLIDHAHCEKKAASTAVNFLFRYPDRYELMQRLSRFAREELRHFEKVLALMKKRGIRYRSLSPARYAGSLHREIRQSEPELLMDLLLISAIIEARSCERFARLVPHLPTDLGEFYVGLLNAEKRHFEVYYEMACELGDQAKSRVKFFLDLEEQLITSPDKTFRFHSGVPILCEG